MNRRTIQIQAVLLVVLMTACSHPRRPSLVKPDLATSSAVTPHNDSGTVVRRCTTANLRAQFDRATHLDGNIIQALQVTNGGPAACSVVGYPELELTGTGGSRLLSVHYQNGGGEFSDPAEPAAPLTMNAGQSVAFNIQARELRRDGTDCWKAVGAILEVTGGPALKAVLAGAGLEGCGPILKSSYLGPVF
jgi:hypothetical protein